MSSGKITVDSKGRRSADIWYNDTCISEIFDTEYNIIEHAIETNFNLPDHPNVIKDFIKRLKEEEKKEHTYPGLSVSITMTAESIPESFCEQIIQVFRERKDPLRKLSCIGFYDCLIINQVVTLPIPRIKLHSNANDDNVMSILNSIHPDVRSLKLEATEDDISLEMGQKILEEIENGKKSDQPPKYLTLKQLHLWDRCNLDEKFIILDRKINLALQS